MRKSKKDQTTQDVDKIERENVEDKDTSKKEGLELKKLAAKLAYRPHILTHGESDNDPSWYKNVPAYLNDVGSLAFDTTAGLPLNQVYMNRTLKGNNGNITPGLYGKAATAYTNYGIMVINVAPTLGNSDDHLTAPNIAANQIYVMMRKVATVTNSFDATDVMKLIMAMDSAYMLYEELLRCYRTLAAWNNSANRYVPVGLLQSLGFNVSLSKNYRDLQGVLDLMAYRMAGINIPDEFDFVRRHSWLFTNVYTDSESFKAQLYAFKPDGYYVYDETGDGPSKLKYVSRAKLFGTASVTTIDQIQQAIDTILDPIFGSSAMGNISAAILKTFNDGDMIRIAPANEHEIMEFSYSQEVLMEIQNMEICGPINTNDVTEITSNLTTGPYLKCTPTVLTAGSGLTDQFDYDSLPLRSLRKTLLSIRNNDPTSDEIMAATRFKVNFIIPDRYAITGTAGKQVVPIGSVGTDFVTTVDLYTFTSSGTVSRGTITNSDMLIPNQAKTYTTNTYYDYIKVGLSQFDWHPFIHLWTQAQFSASTTDVGPQLVGTVGDVDNYLWLEDERVELLNNCALLSEYAVKSYPSN